MNYLLQHSQCDTKKTDWSGYKCKTPVLVIFFNRPDCLTEVLKSLRRVRPSKVYFAQDGPRNTFDIEKIMKCRDIVEELIDWPCDVHTRYSEINLGCEENEYSGLKWAFENEDRLIILEDDVVGSVSFYRFCDELLERYACDYRINSINGFINVEYESPYSYVLCDIGSSCGWATWKRNFLNWDPSLNVMDDNYSRKLLEENLNLNKVMKPIWRSRFKSQHASYDGKCQGWESLYFISRAGFAQHCICSTRPLIQNVGLGPDALHGGSANLTKSQLASFNRPAEEIDFPLKHPKYLIHDYKLDFDSSKLAYNYHWWKRLIPESIKRILRRLRRL